MAVYQTFSAVIIARFLECVKRMRSGIRRLIFFFAVPADDPDTQAGEQDGGHDQSRPLTCRQPYVFGRPNEDHDHTYGQNGPG
jgi:hypothetical protein